MNERFEDLNKREDPQTGNVFRMKVCVRAVCVRAVCVRARCVHA